MTSKEWSYLKEYVLKETGTISHDEYRYDKDEQETFEALIYSALKLYRSGKANKDKLDKAHEEFSKEPIFVETSNLENARKLTIKDLDDLMSEEKNVSMYTITYMYREHKLTKYLKTLDDQELELAFTAVRKAAEADEAKDILNSIEMEKAYRHYSKILEGLREGKTK